jgi:hypothetical protein
MPLKYFGITDNSIIQGGYKIRIGCAIYLKLDIGRYFDFGNHRDTISGYRDDTIFNLQKRLEVRYGINHNMIIKHKDLILENDKSLEYYGYGFKENDKLIIIERE